MFKGLSNRIYLHAKKLKKERAEEPMSLNQKYQFAWDNKKGIHLPIEDKRIEILTKPSIKLLTDGSICGNCMFFNPIMGKCGKIDRLVVHNLVACNEHYPVDFKTNR